MDGCFCKICVFKQLLLLFMCFHYEYLADGKYEEMHLVPEPLFVVSTDNVHVTSMQSTGSGRIFMAGKDGCLYELYYQVRRGVFCQCSVFSSKYQSSGLFLVYR